MNYAITTIWHERNRFLPAILAVAFSAVLIALQAGLLLGLLTMMSTPVDKSSADIWITYPGVRSVDTGLAIPDRWQPRVQGQPEIVQVESCLVSFGLWTLPASSKHPQTLTQICTVVGTRLERDSLALMEPLRENPKLVAKLAEPMTVLVDESDRHRLGVTHIGEQADVNGRMVRVVGFVKGLKSLAGPYAFCSTQTAQALLGYIPGYSTYMLARCKSPADAERVAERLRKYPTMSVYTKSEFSQISRLHWMTTTNAGLALAFTAVLGLIVGAVVTSQTLYAATVAAQREYATLRAMGIPRWRLKLSVVAQSFWVGLAGLIVAAPVTVALAYVGDMIGTQVRLPWFVLLPAALVTLVMALGSGLLALRSLQQVDPVHNIR